MCFNFFLLRAKCSCISFLVLFWYEENKEIDVDMLGNAPNWSPRLFKKFSCIYKTLQALSEVQEALASPSM